MGWTIGEIMESNTGTYRYNKSTGKVEKVSDAIPSIKQVPDWARQMNPGNEISRANEATGDKKMKEIYSKQ